jgi:[ribosomal protein S18]-alanine N-acetyltransferase
MNAHPSSSPKNLAQNPPASAQAGSSTSQQFRPMTLADLDPVMAIEVAAYAHPWSAGNMRDTVNPGYRFTLLEVDGHICGYSVTLRGVDELHLLNITVAPARQGTGLGRALLAEVCDWARTQALHWLWLEVRESNVSAIRLYERFGMARVGHRKDYYPAHNGLREHAHVMNLQLLPHAQ